MHHPASRARFSATILFTQPHEPFWPATQSYPWRSQPSLAASGRQAPASPAHRSIAQGCARPRSRELAPPRQFGRGVARLALAPAHQIGRRDGEGGARSRGVADKGDAAVVGDVEPLVRVGRPGVGSPDATHLGPVPRRGRRPQSEGAIDVEPAIHAPDRVRQGLEGVARAGVGVPTSTASSRQPDFLSHQGQDNTRRSAPTAPDRLPR